MTFTIQHEVLAVILQQILLIKLIVPYEGIVMSERKFYRTVIQVEVLSEEPYHFDGDLSAVAEDISTGDCSGLARMIQTEECDGARMSNLLMAQGSDPSFFMLDE